MKKNMLIAFVAFSSISLTAFAYVNWMGTGPDTNLTTVQNEQGASTLSATNLLRYRLRPVVLDPFYDVSTRFIATIPREKLHQAASILDIVPADGSVGLQDFYNVSVSVMRNGKEITEHGNSANLNPAQQALLQTTNYSTNIHVNADCKKRNETTGALEYYELVYYISITPEVQAQYPGGRQALINYLRSSTKAHIAHLEKDQLRSGQIHFTVSKHGTIERIKLGSSCGYDEMDTKLLNLIATLPSAWTPATNTQGEPVDQDLVFFFGTAGC